MNLLVGLEEKSQDHKLSRIHHVGIMTVIDTKYGQNFMAGPIVDVLFLESLFTDL